MKKLISHLSPLQSYKLKGELQKKSSAPPHPSLAPDPGADAVGGDRVREQALQMVPDEDMLFQSSEEEEEGGKKEEEKELEVGEEEKEFLGFSLEEVHMV